MAQASEAISSAVTSETTDLTSGTVTKLRHAADDASVVASGLTERLFPHRGF